MSDEHHDEPIEVDATEEEVRTSGATAVIASPAPPAAAPSVAAQVGAAELGQRLQTITEAMDSEMKVGTDYGVIPGTDKPALFKPGAEKLSVLFELDIQVRNVKTWGPGAHLTVESQAIVYHVPSGARLGSGEGLCTTHEKKYGKRKQDRLCPECGEHHIKRSKFPPREEPDAAPGWYCYEKVGGCGSNFVYDEPRIKDQVIGEIENPDMADTWNTVVKMAAKRAKVDAVLAVTGASALFTQDVEDSAEAPGNAGQLEPADEEQRARLNAALRYLLPEPEAKRVWGEIKTVFDGDLYGPVVEAVIAPIKARKDIEDDVAATNEEAELDAKAQEESGESAEEKREKAAAKKAGQKRAKK
jgi:hypothetical protein